MTVRGLPLAASDVALWRKLIARARDAAARRTRSVDAFERAGALAAKNARIPDHHVPEKAQPFMALCGFARTWRARDFDGRVANAGAVLALAATCEAALGGAPAPPPPSPSRPPPAPSPGRARLPYRDDEDEEGRLMPAAQTQRGGASPSQDHAQR